MSLSQEYFDELCEKVKEESDLEESFDIWLAGFYDDKINPYDNDPIMMFLLGFTTVTVGNYFFDMNEYIGYVDSFSPKYAKLLKEFKEHRENILRKRSVLHSIDMFYSEHKPSMNDPKDPFRFTGLFGQLEEHKEYKEFFDKILEENPEYKTKWVKIVDQYCEKNQFRYKMDILEHTDFDKLTGHTGDKAYISKVTFPISIHRGQEQTLVFKTKLTAKQAIERVERWLSKPLTFEYYEYIEEDNGIKWQDIPEEWETRGHCLASAITLFDIRNQIGDGEVFFDTGS